MKAVIVNCFDTYEDRVDLVHEFFTEQGYEVTVVQSDFRHFKKVHRKKQKKDFTFISSKPYYKNLSVKRLLSHYQFARDAIKKVEKIKPDILYTVIPPNALAKFASGYKDRHRDVKLIFDLIDLWPETMPIGKAKNFPPFTFWGAMRDKHLKFADFVITECGLYQSVLKDALKGIKTDTLYLAKKEIDVKRKPELSQNEMHLAYLGSINNVIDIPKIREIIETFIREKPVTLHIIGDGESKNELIEAAKSAGATVEYYGKVYESQRKQDIFDMCHFGLNIMKHTVCVGLTMKSIDYFQHGLPIINNIPADTKNLVEKYNVGINLDEGLKDSISSMDFLKLRENTVKLFNDYFSINCFNDSLMEMITYLNNQTGTKQ